MSYTGPVQFGFAITPNDSTDFTTPTRAIYCGTSGDIKADLVGGGAAITFKNMAAGVIHPIRAKRVYATGTTAANLTGLY